MTDLKYPKPEIAEDKKEYFIGMCLYLYEQHLNRNGFNLGYTRTGVRSYSPAELRSFYDDCPNVERFVNIIEKPIEKQSKKNRTSNFNKTPPSVFEKHRKILQEQLVSNPAIVAPIAIDKASVFKKKKQIAQIRASVDPRIGGLAAQAGYPIEGEEGLTTKEDVDTYEVMGGPKLLTEVLLKDLLDRTLQSNDFKLIYNKLIPDLIALNCMTSDIETGPNGEKKVKYVDPAKTIMRNSIHEDGRDQDYRGYWEDKQIGEIAPLIEESDLQRLYACVNEDTLALDYTMLDADAPSMTTWKGRSKDGASVQVATLYWKESVINRYVVGRSKWGNKIFDKVNPDSKLDKRSQSAGKKLEDIRLQKVYRARWVIGTRIVFDYGEEDTTYVGQKGLAEPQFPMQVFMGQDNGIVAKVIPAIEDIILNVFKIRQIIAKIPPAPRIAIDIRKMAAEMQIGGETYSILESLGMYSSEGILLYESQEPDAINEEGRTQGPPIQPVNVQFFEDIRLAIEIINMKQEEIRSVTLINQTADGSSTNPDMLKHVAQQQIQVALNGNMYNVRNMQSYLLRIADVVMNQYTSNPKAISNEMLEALGFTNDKAKEALADLRKNSWQLQNKPVSMEDKQFIFQMLMNRQAEIAPEMFLLAYDAVNEGDLAKARVLIAKGAKMAAEQRNEQEQKLAQVQPQAQAQAQAQITDMKIKEIQAEYAEKGKLSVQEHQQRLVEIEKQDVLKPFGVSLQ